MAPVSEEHKAAYFNRALKDQVGSMSNREQGNGIGAPLEPISEVAEFAADMNSEPRPSAPTASRRQSMLAEVRRVSLTAPRASWGLLRRSTASALSYLTPRLVVYSSDTLQNMPWRDRVDFYLSQPEDSSLGRLIQTCVMVILVVNIAIMASETLDGPRYGGSDPGYPFLPGKSAFELADAGFTAVYVVEFTLRSIVARHPMQYWKSWTPVVDVLALLPSFIHIGLDTIYANNPNYDTVKTEYFITFIQLFRIARLVSLSRMFLGTKILFRVSKKVVAPLKITLFFLITVVMVFATAIFYAEPCYDLSTCTFTDIFNAGYFVMLTVATVGYGSQVPSFSYPGSLFISCVVMLFGTLYLAMPLAIVGIKYDLAWREYDEKQAEIARSSRSPLPSPETAGNAVAPVAAQRSGDETLKALETKQITGTSLQLGEQFFEIGQKLLEIDVTLQDLRREEAGASSIETVAQQSRQRSDSTSKVLDSITTLLKLHKRVCKEVRESLVVDESAKKRRSSSKVSERLLSMTRRGSSSRGANATGTRSGMSKAKSALSAITSRVTIKQRVRHEQPACFRSRVWDIFEHNDRSWRAAAVNRFRLAVVILSIVLFYSQTTPELQLTGLRTVLCRRTIKDFCASNDQPGCFVHSADGLATSELVDFSCAIDTDDPNCYGAGYNYGSDNFTASCSDAFGPRGAKRVCNNRLCKTSESFMLNMEPYWVYFEFVFGILFTIEMLLRVIAHPVPSMLLSDLTLLTDLAVLFPFFVETTSIILGVMPIYSVVPTAPSFLSGVRVLKTLRILKVGTHIPGARVLLKTGELIFRRLLIPLFLLFVGCVVGAAIFYELERGKECYVGQKCMWWDIDVLTPSLAHGLPQGKRILIQDTETTLFTDMLRSTWFSLVTFTTVGYGDLYPRTALGKLFDILCMIGSACYTAMPLTLVGGQFYVCYEVFMQEEKRRRHGADFQIAPKRTDPEKAFATVAGGAANDRDMSFTSKAQSLVQSAALPMELEPISLAGLATSAGDAASIPKASITASGDRTSTRAERSGATTGSSHYRNEEISMPGVSTFELQILNQFFLIYKVLNEIIEDMSSLNRLGAERVATLKKSSAAPDGVNPALEAITARERAIETKIGDNMMFCVTVFLAFTPLIERSQGLHASRSGPEAVAKASPPDAAQLSLPSSALPLEVHLSSHESKPLEDSRTMDRTGRVTTTVMPVPESSLTADAPSMSAVQSSTPADGAPPTASEALVASAADSWTL